MSHKFTITEEKANEQGWHYSQKKTDAESERFKRSIAGSGKKNEESPMHM